ncbi:uncharacterized protein LOC132628621 [Lycium barbarum]|uniref:uncharacterized protein LOC132628621 n=1 Tax=Lycium barbarum TaxID=112863 RepID=UPI00293F4BBC|nr:uncharacterized protein LOC132628621 [Lycium barbarum]
MDFITGLPRSRRKFDSIWVIVDRLTKSAHFLPVRTTYAAEDYANLYLKEIVHLHGIPVSIILDRGAQFTAKFWIYFQESLRTRVNLGSAFHPQLDGQAEQTIRTLEDMLRACVGQVAYELELPSELQAVHPVFHVSMLRKCIRDPSRIVPVDDIEVTENLTYKEEPIAILDRQVSRLRNKDVASVKVLWKSKDREEMMWEAEEEMNDACKEKNYRAQKGKIVAGRRTERVPPTDIEEEEHEGASAPAPTPPVPLTESSGQKVKEAIYLLTQLVTAQAQRQGAGHGDRAASSRARDLIRLNPPEFFGSNFDKDPQGLIDGMLRTLRLMHS